MSIKDCAWMRPVLMAGAIGAALGISMPGAAAQTYPTQDIHFICAFQAGSGSDTIVRYMAEKLRPIVGRTIIVENKQGAGGNIATEFAARAKPDGYTVYVHAGSALAANMHLFRKPPVDAAKAIQVAATINRQPFIMAVDARKPWKTVADVTSAMKEKGTKATYATSAPTGTIMGELYKQATGVQATEVVYKVGAESLNDMLSGAIDYDPVYAMSQQRAGTLRLLAVSTKQRLQANPDLPTMEEAGIPNVDLMGWFAAMVPAGTPRPIVDQLNKWFSEVVAMDDTRKFLNGFGGDPWVTTIEEGQARLLKDIDDWADYVRIAKIEPQG